MMIRGRKISAPCKREANARPRLGANERMLAAYFAYFTVALLIFDAVIFLSLVP